jgi:hypothetical protein
MDPDAALRDALEALRELRMREDSALPDELPEASAGERQQAVDCLRNLADWLAKGGFAPRAQAVILDDAG